MFQDLSYAARTLRKHPGFTAMAVITLALGIGASSTIFSALNTVVMQPLPYHDPDRLVRLWESNLKQKRPENPVSVPNFQDWQKQQTVFEQLAASELTTFNLTGNGEPQCLARDRWVPRVLDPTKEPWRADRANRNLSVFGRLKPNVTIDQANSELN